VVQIALHQLVPKTNRKNHDGKKRYSSLADGGDSDLAGTLRPEKKCTVVWPAMFFSGFKLQQEKNTTGKKGTVESSDRLFFPACSNYNQKNYDRKNKRYSRLADGGGSDLGGMLRPKKKTYSRLAGYVFPRIQITSRKNYDRKKKDTVESSDRPFFPADSYYNQKKI
jgi:hypothetical protein